ncbi:DUF6630 family protein [Elizabethkingia anophelis]|uniref:Uncharacterized protein n=1 Tax=Elizabethkingia anophelis TaxID=1117645 RepID=A0A1T3D6E2_9FLAO|nr:hypothetical protein [Elizabethkingia anophelis]AQW91414.1 hypothetical protein BBD28_12430 [Elizabethkingia anophelis]AQW96872.1 hypothetical protein BBD31_02745 [Elizabethkingia anophelis]AQX49166.1 hypothetical protein AYC66_00025 [Elizabethkingia anophelis]AQX87507.1 hypothetical protein AYC67_00025 [Elizabethkingia anophelis]ASV80080.1 hypothetical protein A6J37_16475 [Elizabethkingia anophelis]
MWNPFRKKKKIKHNKYNFDFESFYKLFMYLQEENSYVETLVEGQQKVAEMIWYEIPNSYQDIETELNVLKNNGFSNFYELLNKVHEKAEIGLIDTEEWLKNDGQYNLMQFNFRTDPSEEEQSYFKSALHKFYVLFVIVGDGEEINAYRIFYKRGMDYSIAGLLDSTDIVDLNNPDSEIEPAIAELEKVLAAMSQETGVEINKGITDKYPNARVSREITLQDFKDVLGLANYWEIEDLEEKAQYLYEQNYRDKDELIAELEEKDEDWEYYDDGYFPLRFEIIHEDNYWYSDWKFDPEDIEGIIGAFLDESWNFNYPEETYSHDLFPYIQKALAERDLELMNMNTLGDSYGFFLVKKENVAPLLSLSAKMALGIEQLR